MHIPAFPILALTLAASLLSGGPNLARGDTIRIGGMGSGMGMLPLLFAAYEPASQNKLEVVPGLGSNGGLKALGEGAVDIAISGRDLNPEEILQGMAIALTVRTPFVLVSSMARPDGFNSGELAALLRSTQAAWSDGTPIKLVLRPRSDSDNTVFAKYFPDMAATLDALRQRPEIPVAATDQDNADLAESMPGSLTAATLTQIVSERRALHFVSIDGIKPNVEEMEKGRYRFAKSIYFVLPQKRSALAVRFVEFLRTAQGESSLRQVGVLSGGE